MELCHRPLPTGAPVVACLQLWVSIRRPCSPPHAGLLALMLLAALLWLSGADLACSHACAMPMQHAFPGMHTCVCIQDQRMLLLLNVVQVVPTRKAFSSVSKDEGLALLHVTTVQETDDLFSAPALEEEDELPAEITKKTGMKTVKVSR